MAAWTVVAAFNLVTAAAYLTITVIIVRGLARTRQLSTNRLAVATATIFTTCAAHHALHAQLLLSGGPSAHTAAMRDLMSGWPVLVVDGAAVAAGVTYLGFRRSYGLLMRSPAMFDDAAEARYRQLAAHMPDTTVLVIDREMRILLAEGEGLAQAGLRRADLEGRFAGDALPAGEFGTMRPHYAAALAGEPSEVESVDAATGRTLRARMRPLRDESGDLAGGLVLVEDVSRERAASRALERANALTEAVLHASPDITAIIELPGGTVQWSSRSLWEMLGWTAAEAAEHTPDELDDLVVEADRPRVVAANRSVMELADGESLLLRFRMRDAAGGHRWLSRTATPFERGADGTVRTGIAAVRDVTDIVDAEMRLEHAALHDPLTGLPNRALLLDRLTSAMARSARTATDVVVLFCDLDGFKRVNDTDGHAAGDVVLVEIARRLRSALREGDAVARAGGDEFVVVLEIADGGRRTALALARRIREEVNRPVRHGDRSYTVSVSIGLTFAGHGRTAGDVLRDADIAMYRAKEQGKDRVEVFDDTLRADLVERGRVETALRLAVAPGRRPPELTVAYQPVHDLATGRLVGFEALARLTDAHGIAVPPTMFIDVAEETGLINPLGNAVLDAALAELVQWRAEHPADPPVRMAVNLSARQAQRSDMVAIAHKALARHGLSPDDLTVELTESVLIEAGSSTLRQLAELHESGVGIAIDDFGTGYASLRYLTSLPVTCVKIDRSFTTAMMHDPAGAVIVRTVAALAADLGLDCVAEGIETRAQLDRLPHAVLGQGFLLGRPAPRARVTWSDPG